MKVSRAELYRLVWKTPMSRLVAQFGVSDVALAKTCRRLDVPTPGRGYWARLKAGARPPRTPLPRNREAPEGWTFSASSSDTRPGPPRPERPEVPLPKNLRRADGVVAQLASLLAEAKEDNHGRLALRSSDAELLVVTLATHRRALLVIAAFSKAVRSRGHALELDGGADADQPSRLVVRIGGDPIAMSVVEILDKREHVLTPEEAARVESGFRYGIPKYDFVPSGRLQIALQVSRGERAVWSETRTRALEAQLGLVIVAAEVEHGRREAGREREAAARAEEERRRLAKLEEDRLRREEEARAEYAEALRRDLKAMARAWTDAKRIAEFLGACEAAIPKAKRAAEVDAWFAWAHAEVASMDPLGKPESIPKRLQRAQ